MNHYEELGVSPSASTAEIRQAYKSLVRVLHPDQQQDDNLRRLSELQLRRLNDLFQILSDPEQRRIYDLSLQRYLPVARRSEIPEYDARKQVSWSDIGRVRLRLRIPPGVMVWLLIGTIALGSAVVWLRSPEPGDHSPLAGESSQAVDAASDKPRTKLSPLVADVPAQPVNAVDSGGKKAESQSAAVGERRYDPRRPDDKGHIGRPATDPPFIATAQAASSRKGPNENLSTAPSRPSNALVDHQDIGVQGPANSGVPVVSPNTAEALDPPPVSKSQSTSISGKWLYVPTSEDGRKTLYAPEYIELRINNRAGLVRGKYYGKYRVSDRAISSEINFQFEGRQGETVSVLPWASQNGAKGELRLKRLSNESLEVNWITTTFGQANTLASGTAVLYRSDP